MANLSDIMQPYYRTEKIALNGNFPGTQFIQVTRIGDVVYITSDQKLTHSSSFVPASSTGLIPTWARPGALQDDQGTRNASGSVQSLDLTVQTWAAATGQFRVSYARISTGASFSRTDSGIPVHTCYRVA